MINWFHKVTSDITELPNCIAYYENELINARRELKPSGRLENISKTLPSIVDERFSQLQTIEAILEHLNIDLRKLRSEKFKKFLEHYNRALTSRDAEKYVDSDLEVVSLQKLVNELALMRNYWLGIMKGLDNLNWRVGDIVKLRVAGLDDARLD
jgi:hypothetical protein